MEENIYLTAKKLSQYLHISKSTVCRYINTSFFSCHKVGIQSLFSMKEVEAALIKVDI